MTRQPAARAGLKLSVAELDRLGHDLLSVDDERVRAAVVRLAESGTPDALDRLLEALALGLRTESTAVLLDALGAARDPRVIPMLALYSGNQHRELRRAAVRSLVEHEGPLVVDILLQRLGDSDADVRARAAEALAERRVEAAVARLYALLRRGDVGAAGPLGRLAPLDLAPRVAELRGLIPDAAVASALGEFLKRPGAPDRLRLDIVRTLGQLPGADATTALIEYVASLAENETPPSKQEAQRLIDARGEP